MALLPAIIATTPTTTTIIIIVVIDATAVANSTEVDTTTHRAGGQLLRAHDLEGELPGGDVDLDQRALVPVGGPHRGQGAQHGLLNTCVAREGEGGDLPELGGLELRGGAHGEGAWVLLLLLVARDGEGHRHGAVGVLGGLDGLGLL